MVALPTYLTGEGAEDAVSRAPGVTETLIEQHQDAALLGTYAIGALGLFALWALWRYRNHQKLPPFVYSAALGSSLAVCTLMGWVGLLGGAIRHTGRHVLGRSTAHEFARRGEEQEHEDSLRIKDLRHIAAIAWARAGVPLRQSQVYLGHSSITQTLAYARYRPALKGYVKAAGAGFG